VTRQFSTLAIVAALAAPAVWADRAERAERTRAQMSRYTTKAPVSEGARALVRSRISTTGPGRNSLRVAAQDQRGAYTPAPGAVQVNLFDTGREAYFVATQTIPAGSTVQAFILLPDKKQEWALESLNVTEDLPPGFSFFLPGIKTLGDFWQEGLTTYFVVVNTGAGETLSQFDFATKGFFRNLSDTNLMVPGINSWRQFYADGSAFLEIKGRFQTGTPTDVVFEDIVAPQSAIQVIDSSTIQVNLSQVPNFDTSLMKSYLLTVGQFVNQDIGTWSDVAQFRFTPLQ